MKKIKGVLLSISSVATVVAPIATVVACEGNGVSSAKKLDMMQTTQNASTLNWSDVVSSYPKEDKNGDSYQTGDIISYDGKLYQAAQFVAKANFAYQGYLPSTGANEIFWKELPEGSVKEYHSTTENVDMTPWQLIVNTYPSDTDSKKGYSKGDVVKFHNQLFRAVVDIPAADTAAGGYLPSTGANGAIWQPLTEGSVAAFTSNSGYNQQHTSVDPSTHPSTNSSSNPSATTPVTQINKPAQPIQWTDLTPSTPAPQAQVATVSGSNKDSDLENGRVKIAVNALNSDDFSFHGISGAGTIEPKNNAPEKLQYLYTVNGKILMGQVPTNLKNGDIVNARFFTEDGRHYPDKYTEVNLTVSGLTPKQIDGSLVAKDFDVKADKNVAIITHHAFVPEGLKIQYSINNGLTWSDQPQGILQSNGLLQAKLVVKDANQYAYTNSSLSLVNIPFKTDGTNDLTSFKLKEVVDSFSSDSFKVHGIALSGWINHEGYVPDTIKFQYSVDNGVNWSDETPSNLKNGDIVNIRLASKDGIYEPSDNSVISINVVGLNPIVVSYDDSIVGFGGWIGTNGHGSFEVLQAPKSSHIKVQFSTDGGSTWVDTVPTNLSNNQSVLVKTVGINENYVPFLESNIIHLVVNGLAE